MKTVYFLPLLALCACDLTNSVNFADLPAPVAKPPVPEAPVVNPLFFGATGDTSANGLEFAGHWMGVPRIEDAGPVKVRVVRTTTDWDSGETTQSITDETVEFSRWAGPSPQVEFTITLDGQTLVLEGDDSTIDPANDETWQGYAVMAGDESGLLLFSNVNYGEDPAKTGEFDAHAFFVAGYETDPAEMAALSGQVGYFGEFVVDGAMLSDGGNTVSPGADGWGDISIMADFGNGNVEGNLEGEVSGYTPDGAFYTDFNMGFSTDIQGNGYAAALNCNPACSDNASNIGGVFFGEDASETSGVMSVDITTEFENDDDQAATLRFVGSGGYVALGDLP